MSIVAARTGQHPTKLTMTGNRSNWLHHLLCSHDDPLTTAFDCSPIDRWLPAKLLPLPHAQRTSDYDSASSEMVCHLSLDAAMRVTEGPACEDNISIRQRSWAHRCRRPNAASKPQSST